jgi:twitching motility protein PilT
MHSPPVVGSQIDTLLDVVWRADGTDLLLSVGMAPQMRIQGNLMAIPGSAPLRDHDLDMLLSELLTPSQASAWKVDGEYDFSFSWRDEARVRANAFGQRGQLALALRLIPMRVPTIAELGLPPVLSEFARMHQGLVLVTGPTGSGKSTTLASMIDQINHERACHIITIEDPIEYLHQHKRAMVNQREVGTDTESFHSGLRAALRSDPDVLLIGEMRDLESISTALTVAETGHLVLATLHTNDTAQSLSRIIDVFPPEQQGQVRMQVAAALTGVVYQRLVPRIGGGLVAVTEVLVANPAVRNLILEKKTHQLRNVLLTSMREGMFTFEQSLNHLIRHGLVSYEEAVARSAHPKDIEAPPPMVVATGAGVRAAG